MSTVTGWFPLVLTTFFGGVVGSLITTYGSQTGERRDARSQVRAALYRTGTLVNHSDNEGQLSQGLDEFEITAILAGLPKGWVQLYSCVSAELEMLLREDSHDSKEFLKIIRFLTQEVTQALNAT